MDIKKIQNLIAKRECQHIEFKTTTGQLKGAFETICAFLNGQGGIVLIGVNDKCQIVGQDVSDTTRQEIARELHKVEPAPQIDVQYIPVERNKHIIIVQVEAGKHVPYIYDGRPYQRNQSTTNRMSQHRYEQLLVERGQLNHSWELLIATDYTINDLDLEEIHRAVRQGITVNRVPPEAQSDKIEDILDHWNLIKNNKLTNAAVVLFAKEVLPGYAQCHIKMGRFIGTNMLGDFIDNKEFYGNAFRILSEASNFVMRHLPIASFFDPNRFERMDQPALPVLAIREALVNAVCHRDYSNRAASISLAIFDDRMEIWNNGKLPSELRLEDLRRQHKSLPRNKIISNVFYDRKFFDGWGTGTTKIVNLCRESDIPDPEFEEYSGGLAVTFRFKELIGPISEIAGTKYPLTQRQDTILTIINKHGAVNLQQLIAELENPPSERMIRKDLTHLRNHGFIDLRGAARNSLWVSNEKKN
jgi:ATP-dependent DNA helicase RecG